MAQNGMRRIVGVYARLMDRLTVTAFAVLVITFVLYLSGLVPPYVPLPSLPRLWGKPVSRYLAATGVTPGWSWVARLAYGDFLNFLPLAFLGSVIALCYAALACQLLKVRERLLGVLAILQIFILALAASGLFRGQGH